MFLELFPIGLPHIDVEPDFGHVLRQKRLDLRFIPGDAGDNDHVAQESDRLVAALVDLFEKLLTRVALHVCRPSRGSFYKNIGAAACAFVRRRVSLRFRSGGTMTLFNIQCLSPLVNRRVKRAPVHFITAENSNGIALSSAAGRADSSGRVNRASRFCANKAISRLAISWTRSDRLNCASVPVNR